MNTEDPPERQFPILWGWRDERTAEVCGWPKSIPWDVLRPHEAWAQRNHGQSLETLARRGGLSAAEACAIIEERHWRAMDLATAVEALRSHVSRPPPAPR